MVDRIFGILDFIEYSQSEIPLGIYIINRVHILHKIIILNSLIVIIYELQLSREQPMLDIWILEIKFLVFKIKILLLVLESMA